MSGPARPGNAVLGKELKDARARYALPRGELRDGKKRFGRPAAPCWHAAILSNNLLSFEKELQRRSLGFHVHAGGVEEFLAHQDRRLEVDREGDGVGGAAVEYFLR